MARAEMYVCDVCGQTRAAELSVDLDRRETAEDEMIETAHLDLCMAHLGRALNLALPYIPMTSRREWFDAVRKR